MDIKSIQFEGLECTNVTGLCKGGNKISNQINGQSTAQATVFEERLYFVQLVVMQKELQAKLLQPPHPPFAAQADQLKIFQHSIGNTVSCRVTVACLEGLICTFNK